LKEDIFQTKERRKWVEYFLGAVFEDLFEVHQDISRLVSTTWILAWQVEGNSKLDKSVFNLISKLHFCILL